MASAPDTSEAVAAAVEQLEGRSNRDPDSGRFTRGNRAAWKTGHRSQALEVVLAEAKDDLLAQVRQDLAADESAAATLQGTADAYVEASLLRRSLFHRLAREGGAVTGKGRTRAALGVYLSVLDRELRLAQALGFERKARAVPSVGAFVARKAAEARAERGEEPSA